MRSLIIFMSISCAMFIFMHEFDAFHKNEWKMFGFLKKWDEKKMYLFFLYAHIPVTLLLFYYLWTTFAFSSIILWTAVNIFLILHFVLHIMAKKWKTNVFHSVHSFIFIGGAAISALISLFLIAYY